MRDTKKQEKFKLGSKRAEIFSRFIQSNLDSNKKKAAFLVKHPKLTLWLMKKDPRVALILTAMILLFYPEKLNSGTEKKLSKQAVKSFFQLLQKQNVNG